MATYISIKRDENTVTLVRSQLETASENPLTDDEQLINQLYDENKELQSQLKEREQKNKELMEENEKLKLIIEKGLGPKDLENDISPMHEI